MFSNPKNNSPQSVHGLHFSLPLLESEYFTFPFSTKNGLYNSGSEKQKIKLQKTPGNLLDKLRKLYIIMERSSLEIFSHPHRKFLSAFLSLNRYLRENRPNYSSLHRNLLLVSKFKCAIPIENMREFRSDGAGNVSFCAQFAYRLTKWPKWAGPRNRWPVQGPSNEALIFYDAGISAKLRSCRFVTSQLNVTETCRTNFSSLLFY